MPVLFSFAFLSKMIHITGKTNGKPVSSLSFDLLTPSTKMKVIAIRQNPRGIAKEKEATALYEYMKEMQNVVSCAMIKNLIGSKVEPVEMEFGSIESALVAKAKIDTLNTSDEWSGWFIYHLFFNTPVTNPLPSN